MEFFRQLENVMIFRILKGKLKDRQTPRRGDINDVRSCIVETVRFGCIIGGR